MGKFTEALKKAAQKSVERVEKLEEFKPYVVKTVPDSSLDPHIVTYFDPASPVSEQYRILRTNLHALDRTHPPKVFAVTSSIHGEGKTITSINCAITFARDTNRKSVLLVDADLRRGKLTKDLGLKAETGLSEILTDGVSVDQALLSFGVDNLHVLSSGARPQNPAELLGSQRMRDLMAEVKKQYDYVFFDCPPVIPITDAGVLGSQCDGVLMIIQAGRTQRGAILHAQDLLRSARAKVLGFIMTHIEYHIPEYIYRYL